MATTVTSVSPDGKSLSPNVQSGKHPVTENIAMPGFAHGFDHDHSALIMTVRPREAKRSGSQREAELWVNQYGNYSESYRILDGEQLLGCGPRSLNPSL
jgi:hypothetical protein